MKLWCLNIAKQRNSVRENLPRSTSTTEKLASQRSAHRCGTFLRIALPFLRIPLITRAFTEPGKVSAALIETALGDPVPPIARIADQEIGARGEGRSQVLPLRSPFYAATNATSRGRVTGAAVSAPGLRS